MIITLTGMELDSFEAFGIALKTPVSRQKSLGSQRCSRSSLRKWVRFGNIVTSHMRIYIVTHGGSLGSLAEES